MTHRFIYLGILFCITFGSSIFAFANGQSIVGIFSVLFSMCIFEAILVGMGGNK